MTRPTQARSAVAVIALGCLVHLGILSGGLLAQGGGRPPTACALPQGEIPVLGEKGANYLIGSTTGKISTFLLLSDDDFVTPGSFNEQLVRQELQALKDAGVQNIRTFGSFWGWMINGDDYLLNLGKLADICDDLELDLMFALWSGTSDVPAAMLSDLVSYGENDEIDTGSLWCDADVAHYTYLSQPIFVYALVDLQDAACAAMYDEPHNMSWRSEPGREFFQEVHYWDLPVVPGWQGWPEPPEEWEYYFRQYVQQTAETFQLRGGLEVTYDLYNEPDAIPCYDDPECEPMLVNTYVRAFIEFTDSIIRTVYMNEEDPLPPRTIGFAHAETLSENLSLIHANGLRLSLISVHSYATPIQFGMDLAAARIAATALCSELGEPVLPVVCTEFYAPHLDFDDGMLAGTLHLYLQELANHNVPGFVWNPIASNVLLKTPSMEDDDCEGIHLDGFLHPTLTAEGHLAWQVFPDPGSPDYDDLSDFVGW